MAEKWGKKTSGEAKINSTFLKRRNDQLSNTRKPERPPKITKVHDDRIISMFKKNNNNI